MTGMKLSADNFDLWVFRRSPQIEYLLLKTSQEKAKRFFSGGQFWQIPTDVFLDEETVEEASARVLKEYGQTLVALWAGEHTYSIYNRRHREVAIIPVFVAEVSGSEVVTLSWEHSEWDWCTANECFDKVHYRGLKEGLSSVREYVTETDSPAAELRLV